MNLINKAALVAEIENLETTYKKRPTYKSYEEGLKDGRLIGYKDVLHKINTLEVKEVDLEKELDNYFNTSIRKNLLENDNVTLFMQCRKVAKHFFELGLKVAQKGE